MTVQAAYQTRDHVNVAFAAPAVRGVAQQYDAGPQPGKGREHESAESGHSNRLQCGEDAEGLRREQRRVDHAGGDISGEEQIVELEYAAEGDEEHDFPDGAGRQPVESEGDFARQKGRHVRVSPWSSAPLPPKIPSMTSVIKFPDMRPPPRRDPIREPPAPSEFRLSSPAIIASRPGVTVKGSSRKRLFFWLGVAVALHAALFLVIWLMPPLRIPWSPPPEAWVPVVSVAAEAPVSPGAPSSAPAPQAQPAAPPPEKARAHRSPRAAPGAPPPRT